jgi:ribosomal protein L44E
MTQHFTRNTVSAEFWCSKCSKFTQHRIDDCRKGPCLECMARYDNTPKVVKAEEKQKTLWEDAS